MSDLSKWGLTDEQVSGATATLPALPPLPSAQPPADAGKWGLSAEQVMAPDPAEAIRQQVASSPDPVSEQAKVDSSIAMAKALGVPPGMVFQHYDSFATQWTGTPEKPTSLWGKLKGWVGKQIDATGNTFTGVQIENQINALSMRQLSGDKSPELQARIEEMKAKIPKDQLAAVPKGLMSILYGLGYQAYAGGAFVADNVAALMSGEYMARAVGQKPATNFLGYAQMAGEAFSGSFSGAAYRGLRDAGVDDGVATGAALGMGLLQAALMGLRVSEIPGIKQLTNEALITAAKKAALSGTLQSSVVTAGKRMLGSTLEQAAFGGAAASINAVGREFAIELNNRVDGTNLTHATVGEILGEIGLGAAVGGAFGALAGVPGAMIEGGKISNMAREMAKQTAERTAPVPGTAVLADAFQRSVPNLEPGAADVAAALIEARAKAQGMTTEAWTAKYLDPNIFGEMQPGADTLAQTEALHGTAYDFQQFDAAKAGTGEGNASFGAGIYMTSREDIAKYYADFVSRRRGGEARQVLSTSVEKDNFLSWYETPTDVQKKAILTGAADQAIFGNMENKGYLVERFKQAIKTGTTEDVYKYLSMALGSDKAASDFLSRSGVDGIKYPTGTISGGNVAKSFAKGTNYVVFDPGNIQITDRTFFQGNKAAVTFAEGGRAILHAFKGADFTSLVHESAHIFRRQLDAPDLAIAEKHYGVQAGKWETAHEERFATDFETWATTGKAPTPELATLFQKVAELMKSVYRTLAGKGEVSPEMQKVFENLFKEPAAKQEAPARVMEIRVAHEPEVKTTVTDAGVRIDSIDMAGATPEEASKAILRVARDNPGKPIEWNPTDAAGMELKKTIEELNPHKVAQETAKAAREAEVKAYSDALAKETDPGVKALLSAERDKAQAALAEKPVEHGLQHFEAPVDTPPVEPVLSKKMEDFWTRLDKETQSSEAASIKGDPVVDRLTAHIAKLEEQVSALKVASKEEIAAIKAAAKGKQDALKASYQAKREAMQATLTQRIDALRAAKNAKIEEVKATFRERIATAKQQANDRAEVKKIVISLRDAQAKPMRPEFKTWVDEILAPFNIEAGTPRKLSKLAELKTRLETMTKEGAADFSESDIALLNEAAAKDLPSLTMDEWRAVNRAVRYYVKAQNDFHGVKVRGKRIDRAVAARDAQAEMPELKKVQDNIVRSNPTLKEKIGGKAGSVRDFFGRHMTPWDHLMAVVGGGEDSVLYDAYKQVHGSDTAAVLSREGGQRGALKWTMDRNAEFTKAVEDVAKRVGDIDKFRTEVVTMKMTSMRPGSARTVEKTVSLTRGDRIAMKFLMAQEDSRRDLVSSGFQFKNRKGRERWEPIRLSESQMQAVADSLTPDELVFYDAMRAGFKKAGLDVGKQYLDVHDFSMDLQQEYFPIDRMEVGRGTAPEADTAKEQFKKTYLNIGMPKGRTIERTHTVGPIYVRDAFEVFREHMDWAGQYINVDQPVLNAAKLLKDLQPDIVKRWGESMYRELEAGLRRVVNNAQDFNSLEKFMMSAKSGLVASTGSMNPIWWMNDVLGASRFYTSGLVDGKNYILGAMEALAHPTRVHKELMQWSTEYSKFRQELGFNKDMLEAMKAAKKTAVGRGLSTIRGVLAYPARVINRAMSRVGMKGAFNTAMEQLQSGKLSEQVKTALGIKDTAGLAIEQKMALAYRYAEYALEHTQVVPMAEMHSSFQEGSWLEQTLATYGSDAIRAQTLMKETIRKAVNNPTAHNKAAVVKVMIGLLVFEPVAQQIAYDIRDKLAGRKPQGAVGMIGQEAYYFPVVRDIVRLASDAFTGRGIGGGSILITDQAISMFKNFLTGFADWVSGDTQRQQASGMWKFIDNGVRMLMTALKLPYSTPKVIVKALTKE